MNRENLDSCSTNTIAKSIAQTVLNTKKISRWNKSNRGHCYFWLLIAISSAWFWIPIKNLITFSFSHDYGSHVVLVAPISIFLIFLKRRRIFSGQINLSGKTTGVVGSTFLLLGLIAWLVSRYKPLAADQLSLEVLSLLILWISAFVFCYGRESFNEARFPLMFLLLLVPLPAFLIDKIIFALQAGSSDVAYGLLRILNVPVLKEGFILRLPMVNLEVAKECSGIRSSIALLVTMLVAAEFALRSSWGKVLLIFAIIPILVLKNGVRIVTIYVLAAYLNPAFLHGWLHTSGGVVFYLLGLFALIPVTVFLQKWERKAVVISRLHELTDVPSV